MKTKYMTYSLSALVVLAIGFTGCSNDTTQSSSDSSSNTPPSSQYTAGTIKYEDGTDFGVTRKEAMNNGGFQIYSIGTGEVIGFIQVDGSVNDIGGIDLGVCENASVTTDGLSGDCVIPKPTAPQSDDDVKTQNPQSGDDVNTPNTANISDAKYPAIPNYAAGVNSIGQLEVNCKKDIIYYTLAYVCFKSTVKLSTTADGKAIAEDEDSKRGVNPWTYYERGQYKRDGSGKQVTIVGTVTGGNPGGTYRKTCPSI